MASLYIKDSATNDRAERLARRLATTKTDVVGRGLKALEDQLGPEQPEVDFVEWVRERRRRHPLPPLPDRGTDKAVADWLSGEEDVHDPFR